MTRAFFNNHIEQVVFRQIDNAWIGIGFELNQNWWRYDLDERAEMILNKFALKELRDIMLDYADER